MNDDIIKKEIGAKYYENVIGAKHGFLTILALYLGFLLAGFMLFRGQIQPWIYIIVTVVVVIHSIVAIYNVFNNKRRIEEAYAKYKDVEKHTGVVCAKEIAFETSVVQADPEVFSKYAKNLQFFIVSILDDQGYKKRYLTTDNGSFVFSVSDEVIFIVQDKNAATLENGEVLDGIITFRAT